MNSVAKISSVVLLGMMLVASCNTKKPVVPEVDHKAGMIAADREFSKMSEEKGIKSALLHFIDTKGVLLRPNVLPLVGGNAVDYISQGSDSAYTMTWEPSGGLVAKSGELGYTYGVYSIKPRDKDTVLYGTYVSVWKRQDDGKWKFLLETGNEGID